MWDAGEILHQSSQHLLNKKPALTGFLHFWQHRSSLLQLGMAFLAVNGALAVGQGSVKPGANCVFATKTLDLFRVVKVNTHVWRRLEEFFFHPRGQWFAAVEAHALEGCGRSRVLVVFIDQDTYGDACGWQKHEPECLQPTGTLNFHTFISWLGAGVSAQKINKIRL
jgi:hypothetical protein